jgi:hypothetical protein
MRFTFPSPAVAAVTALLLVAGSAPAQVYSGTTVGGPIWNRPVANANNPPSTLSNIGTAVPYHVQSFTVSASGTYTFFSQALLPPNWDNYLFLYQNAFDPASPLANALIGNDDFGNVGRSSFDYAVNSGTSYFLVTTGFANSNAGTFTNTITGPGVASFGTQTVPEPSTVALVASGLLGLVGVARRRARAS